MFIVIVNTDSALFFCVMSSLPYLQFFVMSCFPYLQFLCVSFFYSGYNIVYVVIDIVDHLCFMTIMYVFTFFINPRHDYFLLFSRIPLFQIQILPL